MNTKVLHGILHTHLIYFNRSLFIFSYLSLPPFSLVFSFPHLNSPHLLLCPLFLRETPHMRENTQYLSSSWWLISLSLIPAPIFLQMAPLHSFSCLRKSAAYGHPSFFICLSGEHLSGLHTSIFMSSAVICVRIQAALLDADSGEHAQKWKSWVTWATTFLKTVNTCQLKGLDEDCEQKLKDVSRLWCL